MADPSSSKPIQRANRFTYTKPTEERPFSSSAAKRSSVMALGRIDHLQHYFAREARRVHKESNGPLPIYAGQENVVEMPEEEEDAMPETPKAEPRKPVFEWDEPEERVGWKEMRENVWKEIDQVCQRWNIVDHIKRDAVTAPEMSSSRSQDSPIPSSPPSAHLVLDLITSTTTAIRSVQHFVISLPTEFGSLTLGSTLTTRHTSQLNISTASRPRTSLNALPVPSSTSMKRDPSNPSNELRTACLDVLGTLKEMDLNYRVNDVEGEERVYREASLQDLGKEKEEVRQWIQIVDRTLFATMRKSGVGEERSLSPLSVESPGWAKSKDFEGDTLLQAHHLIRDHLPTELLSHLESPSGNSSLFLESLSNGQLLCLSFNAAVRQSTRPWGFIPHDAIHNFSLDTSNRRQASEMSEGGIARVGLTFRRLENLRVWVAAIKLRYGIHLGRDRASSKDDTGSFDLKYIARKEVGWEDMLSTAVKRWTEAVVQEKREEMGL